MSVVGIDFSSRAIHLCELQEDSNLAHVHVVRLDTERGDAITRARRLRDRMPARSAWADSGVTLVAIEKPFSRPPNVAMLLVYGGLLQLLPAEVPLIELRADDWRLECALPRRGASSDLKKASVGFARACWMDPPAAIDDNAADSFCIAFAAREIDTRAGRAAA